MDWKRKEFIEMPVDIWPNCTEVAVLLLFLLFPFCVSVDWQRVLALAHV